MLAIGTDYEYYNAVWVKNEWSRFLKLMIADKTKYLIPCYKGIDAYDMPREFARLQAQDLGKLGAVQDLLRGMEKLLSPMVSAKPDVLTENLDSTYNQAIALGKQYKISALKMAIKKLNTISGWRDADMCRFAFEKQLHEKRKKRNIRITVTFLVVFAVITIPIYLIKLFYYQKGEEQALIYGNYQAAQVYYKKAGNFKDAEKEAQAMEYRLR